MDRLLASVPRESPPARSFFKAYFRIYKERMGAALPALIPEVYLHHHPDRKADRPADSPFVRERMDFLMLLPRDVRAVFEIDGKQHYSDEHGRAEPRRYAQMVSTDRVLKLKGYEVWRFGGRELYTEDEASACVEAFFDAFFRRHGVGSDR